MGLFSSIKKGLTGLGESGGESKSTSEPWSAQKPYLTSGFKQAQDWLNQTKGGNPNISAGWDSQLAAAQSGLGGAVPAGNNINSFFSSTDMLSPESNPYLAQNIDALGNAITQQTGRNQNQIRQQAAQAGAFGGGRQGVAEGLNAEAATQAFAEGSARMLLDNYNQRLAQMQAQQQYLPQLAQLSMMPGMVQEDIGRDQQNIDMDNLMRYWQIVGSNNWGGTTTGSSTQQMSPIQMFQGIGQGLGGLAKGFAGGS